MLLTRSKVLFFALLSLSFGAAAQDSMESRVQSMIDGCYNDYVAAEADSTTYDAIAQEARFGECMNVVDRFIGAHSKITEQAARMEAIKVQSGAPKADVIVLDGPELNAQAIAEAPVFATPAKLELVRTMRLPDSNTREAVINVGGDRLAFSIGDTVSDGWRLADVGFAKAVLITNESGKTVKRTLRLGRSE